VPVRVLILRAAGTNCDGETAFAFQKAGAATEPVHVSALIENPKRLADFQILAFPGGFSYGDDVAAGKILANRIIHHLADAVRGFIDAGRLVIGICNGFQTLVRAGLLPAVRDGGTPAAGQATLAWNANARFQDRWVRLRGDSDRCVFVRKGQRMYLPIAHGEGRFLPVKDEIMQSMTRDDQIAVRYTDADGNTARDWPDNPNGSTDAIAGVCDPTGRVFGLMPHPERHAEPTQHPRWTREGLKAEGDGMQVFRNAVGYFG
jgi:phosphoribosylformylglycinamidine synthase